MQVLVGLVLLVVGAFLALSAELLLTNKPGPAAQVTVAPSASGSAVAAASPTTSASPSPAAPLLEAELPHTVNGTTLTTESATDATSLGSGPNGRALNAAVTSLGKKSSDLEIADAYDASGSLAASILGFRVAAVDPAKLRTVVLEAWLSTNTPGVTTSNISLSGTPSTKVSYGDGGPDEYVFVHGDSVFVVETTDQTLAASVVTAMAASSPSPATSSSPSPSPSPATSSSPATSPATSPSPSAGS
jgi:hypothetical protein